MYLHCTFADGSNPYVVYESKNGIDGMIAEYNKLRKKYPNGGVKYDFFGNGLHCMPVAGGGFCVGEHIDGSTKTKHYRYLKSALKQLDYKMD